MPKQKTKKGVKKRFKITGSGKVISRRAGKSHLMTAKSRKRKRKLRGSQVLGGSGKKKVKNLLSGR